MGSRYMYFLLCKFWPVFGSSWLLFGPPWPSPGLPSLRFDSLDLRESGSDPTKTIFRPICFVATSEKYYLGFLPPKFSLDSLETIIERWVSKFCISWYQWRVKQSSASNSMDKLLDFILMWIRGSVWRPGIEPY